MSLLLVFSLLVLTACQTRRDTIDRQGDAQSGDNLEGKNFKRRSELFLHDMSVTGACQQLQNNYRLKPDKRFLHAIGVVQSICSHKSLVDSAAASWENGHWRLLSNEREIGVVNAFPGFEELYSVLLSRTKKLVSEKDFKLAGSGISHPEFAKGLKTFSPEQLISAAVLGDHLWKNGEHTAEVLIGTAQCTTALSTQVLDYMGIADDLTAKALAMVALAEATTSCDTRSMKYRLAENMEYCNDAAALANALPDEAPLKMYALKRKAELRKLAELGDNGEAAFLYLRTVCQARDRAAWREWMSKTYPKYKDLTLPCLRAFSEMAATDWLMQLSLALMRSSKQELEYPDDANRFAVSRDDFEWSDTYRRYQSARGWLARDLLSDFEAALTERRAKVFSHSARSADSPGSASPLFGEDEFNSFYRSYFYSAVFALARCYFDMPISGIFLTSFAQALDVRTPGQAKQLQEWLKDRIALRSAQGGLDITKLETDLSTFDRLGAAAHVALFEDIEAPFETNTNNLPRLIPSGRILFSRLDTRPSLRGRLSRIAECSLLDVCLSHELALADAVNGKSAALASRVAQVIQSRNRGGAVALLSAKEVSPLEKASIIKAFGMLGLGSAFGGKLSKAYGTILSESKDSSWAVILYAQSLRKEKNLSAAETALRAWLSRHRGAFALEEGRVRVALAELLSEQKKYHEALSVLHEQRGYAEFDYLRAKVTALLGLSRVDEAASLANEALLRHKSNEEALRLAVEVEWRSGRYSRAAELLAAEGRRLGKKAWSYGIGASFVDVFGKDKPKVMLAVGSLRDEGIDCADNLQQIAHAYYKKGIPELAANVLSLVRTAPRDSADFYTCAYRYRKAWQGRPPALSWLKEQVPEKERYQLAPYAFIAGQYELLWEFIPSVPDEEHAAELRLLRAAAFNIEDPQQAAHRKLIELAPRESDAARRPSDTAQRPSDTAQRQQKQELRDGLVSYLLDEPGSAKVLAVPNTPSQLSESAFFIGWKALSQGRNFYEDCRWYRAGIEFGDKHRREYDWALVWLSDIVRTIADEPSQLKLTGLKHMRVAAPGSKGKWDEMRRFQLSAAPRK